MADHRHQAARLLVAPCRGGQARGLPGFEASDDVGGPAEPHVPQRSGGEAGGEALGAQDDEAEVAAGCLWQLERARGIEPPLKHGPFYYDRTWDLAVVGSLRS
jgi:hypothetical protein